MTFQNSSLSTLHNLCTFLRWGHSSCAFTKKIVLSLSHHLFLVLWLIRNFLLISFRVCNILSALKRIELVDVMNLDKLWKMLNFPKFPDLFIFIWMNFTCSNTVSWLCMYVCFSSFEFSITCRSHFLFWTIFPENSDVYKRSNFPTLRVHFLFLQVIIELIIVVIRFYRFFPRVDNLESTLLSLLFWEVHFPNHRGSIHFISFGLIYRQILLVKSQFTGSTISSGKYLFLNKDGIFRISKIEEQTVKMSAQISAFELLVFQIKWFFPEDLHKWAGCCQRAVSSWPWRPRSPCSVDSSLTIHCESSSSF